VKILLYLLTLIPSLIPITTLGYEFNQEWCDYKISYPGTPQYAIVPKNKKMPLTAVISFKYEKYEVVFQCEMNSLHLIPEGESVCKYIKESTNLVSGKVSDCSYKKHPSHVTAMAFLEVPYEGGGNFLEIEEVRISRNNKFTIQFFDQGLSGAEREKIFHLIHKSFTKK